MHSCSDKASYDTVTNRKCHSIEKLFEITSKFFVFCIYIFRYPDRTQPALTPVVPGEIYPGNLQV